VTIEREEQLDELLNELESLGGPERESFATTQRRGKVRAQIHQLAGTLPARPAPPYPFCRTPDECAGKGYCPKDPSCSE